MYTTGSLREFGTGWKSENFSLIDVIKQANGLKRMLRLSQNFRRGDLLALTAALILPGLSMPAQQKNSASTPAVTGAEAQETNSPNKDGSTEGLIARVGSPSPLAIDQFKKAGMQSVTSHTLTAEEREKVAAVVASLPTLNKRALAKGLHYLAFVDGIPGEGTGLTSPAADTGLYDITLRASVIDESLSSFLTTKERRVYRDDGSGTTVMVTGTGTNALTYILLHESTHVLDKGCGITSDLHNRFVAGIWSGHGEMAPSLAEVAPNTYFRGAGKVPAGKAVSVYNALAQTPFVSLYATASEMEDFAELMAWGEIFKQYQGNLIIEVKDAQGETIKRWEPLTFPAVQKRLVDVNELLVSGTPCSTSS
jgi:hypothetical protein